jgi:hypothetical protein
MKVSDERGNQRSTYAVLGRFNGGLGGNAGRRRVGVLVQAGRCVKREGKTQEKLDNLIIVTHAIS